MTKMRRRCWLPSKKVVKEPHHRFQYHLCKMFGKTPSDSFFEEMDPIEKLWLYESWVNELEIDLEKEKAIAILIGSFSNPEMAQKMHMKDNPNVKVSDDEFEAQLKAQDERFKAEDAAKENPRLQRKKKRKEKRTIVR